MHMQTYILPACPIPSFTIVFIFIQGIVTEKSPYSEAVFIEAAYKMGWIHKTTRTRYYRVSTKQCQLLNNQVVLQVWNKQGKYISRKQLQYLRQEKICSQNNCTLNVLHLKSHLPLYSVLLHFKKLYNAVTKLLCKSKCLSVRPLETDWEKHDFLGCYLG